MHAAVGIFDGLEDAHVVAQAISYVMPNARIRVVAPHASDAEVARLPSDDAEQPGMGAAIGGVVGGAVGSAAGVTAANLLAPGAGVVVVAGVAAAALLGLGTGAVAGNTLEENLSLGVPRDELLVYQEAVRRGRALVVVTTDEARDADAVREMLCAGGARSVDQAREDWRVGLRDPQDA
jgi:hypothetical protein